MLLILILTVFDCSIQGRRNYSTTMRYQNIFVMTCSSMPAKRRDRLIVGS